ncbi:GATA-domain-containing protein [Backusella circina FSU 941]|nr:GATA-domain-containing protein [Backusella circina FSU 941]
MLYMYIYNDSKSKNIVDERPTLPPISSIDGFAHSQPWTSFDDYNGSFPSSSVTRQLSGNHPHPSKSDRDIRTPETFESSKEMFTDHVVTQSYGEVSSTHRLHKEHNDNTSFIHSSTFQTQNIASTSIHPQRSTFQELNQNNSKYETLSQRSIGSSSSNSIKTSSPFASPTLNNMEKCIDEVTHHCDILSQDMTHRKPVILQQQGEYFNNSSLVHPWFDEMIGRANEVLNALLRLKKYQLASEHPLHLHTNNQGIRPGKQSDKNQASTSKVNSTKDSDESGSALSLSGQRRRAKKPPFQGRCHSCNTSETPEWRRGPNGARTLCNACGLHYAKHSKKKAIQERETKEPKEEESTIMK